MILKLLKIISFFVLLFILQTINIIACTCAENPGIYESFDNAAAVFSGKVVSLKNVDGGYFYVDNNGNKEFIKTKDRIYRFQLIESFKGVKEKFVDLNLREFNPNCQAYFVVGESYLIYARKNKDDNILRDGPCSRSTGLDGAEDQIKIIREKLAGIPEAKIYGNVFISENDPNSTGYIYKNLENLTVILQSEEKRFETKTDKSGTFKFYDEIPDGIYKLFPIVSSEFTPYSLDDFRNHALVKVENGKFSRHEGGNIFSDFFNSLDMNFNIHRNNRVKGKIFDGEGKPVKLAAVRLIPVAVPFGEIESDDVSDEDEEGSFSISDITPGKYYLVAEIYAPFGNKNKVRIFYPQSETPEKATPIEIKPIDELSFDFILPQKYILRSIKGTVSWSDGQPIEDVEIKLFNSKNHKVEELNDEIPNTGFDKTKTDELGNFVLWGFENQEYWIHFEDETEIIVNGDEEDVVVKGKPFKIKVKKDNPPLKLTLAKP